MSKTLNMVDHGYLFDLVFPRTPPCLVLHFLIQWYSYQHLQIVCNQVWICWKDSYPVVRKINAEICLWPQYWSWDWGCPNNHFCPQYSYRYNRRFYTCVLFCFASKLLCTRIYYCRGRGCWLCHWFVVPAKIIMLRAHVSSWKLIIMLRHGTRRRLDDMRARGVVWTRD